MPSVTIVLGNRMSYLEPALPQDIAYEVEDFFAVLQPDAPSEPRESDWWLGFNASSSTIYTGLVPYLRGFLKRHYPNVRVDIRDARAKPPRQRTIHSKIVLREYQRPPVEKMLQRGRGSVSLSTGSGKTIVLLETFARLGVPGVMIVPTTVIMRQFLKTARKMLDCEVGQIGQGVWEPKFLTIAIMAGLNEDPGRTKEFLQGVDFFYVDEGHHIASETWFHCLMESEAYYRFGGSGTMLRTDGQDLKLFAPTGPVAARVTSSQLVETGWLAKPKVRMVRVDGMGIGWPGDWATYYANNVIYNPHRTEATIQLIGHSIENDIKTLCLVAWDKHAQHLLAGIMPHAKTYVDYVCSSFPDREIKESLQWFKEGKTRVLIATPLLSEGYDLPSINRLIRASGMKSFIKVTQETGRVLRVEDPPQRGVEVEVWDFFDDDGGPLAEHSQERLETWKSEPAFDVDVVDNWAQPRLGLITPRAYEIEDIPPNPARPRSLANERVWPYSTEDNDVEAAV